MSQREIICVHRTTAAQQPRPSVCPLILTNAHPPRGHGQLLPGMEKGSEILSLLGGASTEACFWHTVGPRNISIWVGHCSRTLRVVLVTHCCVTNHYKLSRFEQHIYLNMTQPVLRSGPLKVTAGREFIRRLNWGRTHLQVHSGCWQKSSSWGRRAATNSHVQVFEWTWVFGSLGNPPGRGLAGSCPDATFDLQRTCQPVLQGSCPILRSYQRI